jgi:hypothetical protein
MIRILSIFLLSFLFTNVNAQSTDTAYLHLFGGKNMDMFRDGIATPDNGLIAVGTTSSYGAGNTDVYVVKTDSMCNKLWSKTFGRNNVEQGYNIKNTKDGAYIIAGFTNSIGNGGYDAYLIKLDNNGNLIWEKTYGGNDWDFAYSVVELADSGFAVCGETYTNSHGSADVLLFRTDKDGNLLWQKKYGGTQHDVANDLIIDVDNNLVLVGKTKSYGNGNEDVYLIKTNLLGDTLWTKTFGDTLNECGNRLIQVQDLGYVIVGYTESFSPEGDLEMYSLKTDTAGIFQWYHIYGENTKDDIGYDVLEKDDGSLIFTGFSGYGAGMKDVYTFNAYFNGWWSPASNTYGGIKEDIGYANAILQNGTLFLFGKTESFGTGNFDALIIRLDTVKANQTQKLTVLNDSILSDKSNLLEANHPLKIYPNPNNGRFFIEKFNSINQVKLYNFVGQEVQNFEINYVNNNQIELNISAESGVYFLHIMDGENFYITKVIIEKN